MERRPKEGRGRPNETGRGQAPQKRRSGSPLVASEADEVSPPGGPPPDLDRENAASRVAKTLLELAMSQVQAQLDSNDNYDLKASGVLAAVVAGLGVVYGARDSLGRGWVVPVAGLVVAAVLALAAIWNRRYATGPDPMDFLDKVRPRQPTEAEVYVELVWDIANRSILPNSRVLQRKASLFLASLVVVVSTTVLTGIIMAKHL